MFCDCTQGGSGALKRLFLASLRPCHFASRQTPQTSAASGAMKGTDETPLPFSTSSVLFPPKLVILRPPKKGRRTHRSVPGTRLPSLPMTVTTSSVPPMRRAKAWERLPARAVQLGDGGDLPRLPPPPSDWLFPEPLPVWSWRPMGKGFGRAPVCSALARSFQVLLGSRLLTKPQAVARRCVRARTLPVTYGRPPATPSSAGFPCGRRQMSSRRRGEGAHARRRRATAGAKVRKEDVEEKRENLVKTRRKSCRKRRNWTTVVSPSGEGEGPKG